MAGTRLRAHPLLAFYWLCARRAFADTWHFTKSQAVVEVAFGVGGSVVIAAIGEPFHIAILPIAGVGAIVILALLINGVVSPFRVHQELVVSSTVTAPSRDLIFSQVPKWKAPKPLSERVARQTLKNGRAFIDQYRLVHGLDENGYPRQPEGDSIGEEVARQLSARSDDTQGALKRGIYHTMGMPYHWDKTSDERFAHYLVRPPVKPNGKIPGGKGTPDWDALSRNFPSSYAREVMDYLDLLEARITRQ